MLPLTAGAADLEILHKKALALFELGKAEEAVSAVNTLLERVAENINIEDTGEIGEENEGESTGEISALENSQAFGELLEKFAFSLIELGKYEEALLPLGKLTASKSASKETLYGKGVVLLKLDRLEEALEAFSDLLSLYPDFDKAWYRRGLILFSFGYYAEALEAFEQAVLGNQKEIPEEMDKEYPEENEAEIQREIEGENQEQIQREIKGENQGKTLDGIKGECQEEIQREKPKESPVLKDKLNDSEIEDAWTKMGLSQLKLGYYEAALETFGRILEAKPEAPNLWYVTGLALRGLDRNQQAIEAFEKAVELDSTLEAAWEQMGLALLGLNRYEEAYQAFSSALIVNSENINALYSRSVASFRLQHFKEAAWDLERVLLLVPDFPDSIEACYRLGIARMELQEYEKALEAFNIILEHDPAHSEALYYRALVLFNLGRI